MKHVEKVNLRLSTLSTFSHFLCYIKKLKVTTLSLLGRS